MQFLAEYGLFLVKTLTLVVAILAIVAGIAAISSKKKGKSKESGHLTLTKLNNKFKEYSHFINTQSLSKHDIKLLKKEEKEKKKAKKNKQHADKQTSRKRLFVLNFHGDIRAAAVANLREEVTAILLTKKPQDEVLLRLESGGGLVNAYGLAASQLQRLKAAEIKLTIAIDKIAASGGYMMACLADHLIAAPFSVVGSIGVVAQLPNFHRYLDKKNVDFEQITAGQYKRTLTLFGKNTSDGRKKFQQEVDETHKLFKDYINEYRPQVDIETIATGEHWFATQALEKQLVDELKTSDDFLLNAKNDYDLFEVHYAIKHPLTKRLSGQASNLLAKFWRLGQQGGQDYL